jgi:uncharacterized protein
VTTAANPPLLPRLARRLPLLVRPRVRISPPPEGVVFERDLEVRVRDGTILRVNVFRPEGPGRHPVIMSAHPYGKDKLPAPRRRMRAGTPRYRIPAQYRVLAQSDRFEHSAWAGWEAPDPAFWVRSGYVVVNADLRGWGRSDGVGEILSAQEGRDYHDLVEWAGAQEWSNGRVGALGVSYLAISQWRMAAEHPAHLACICPWEGFTDAYRDLLRPGGIREDGFTIMWAALLKKARRSPVDLRHQTKQRELRDAWYAERDPCLEEIRVPALVCASFSDHNLHSRGSFEGFRRISSSEKYLYTHRGPKWSTFYSPDAREAQLRFFDRYCKDGATREIPRVRLEVRSDRSTVTAVRELSSWPPDQVRVEPWYLEAAAASLVRDPPTRPSSCAFDLRRGSVSFTGRFDERAEVVGSMLCRLWIEVGGADDALVFLALRKLRHGRVVGFEGSYGFDDAAVTLGWLRASHAEPVHIDPGSGLPVHDHDRHLTPHAGRRYRLDVELRPSATAFEPGDALRLDVQGRWFFRRLPILGQFPAGYERSKRGTLTLHTGGPDPSVLSVPVLPGR